MDCKHFLIICLCILTVLSGVQAALRVKKEVETEPEASQVEKVQEQLMTAFDNFKKSVEEVASKINTQEIAQGFHNFTSMIENYAKKTADQFVSTVSQTTNTNANEKE